MVTLWPSFPHFRRFATDTRLSGIRLNSAMLASSQLADELAIVQNTDVKVPLYFDVKGRQLRVVEVHDNEYHLDITLNHPISVADPTIATIPVLFKAGADVALLRSVEEDGRRLTFYPAVDHGPTYKVRPGESLSIRHPSLQILGPLFIEQEIEKIQAVKKAGFTNYFLSYVEQEADVTQFVELVGDDSQVMLKIESQEGLRYVAEDYVARPNVRLVAARGDLYVEIARPHEILSALKLIIEKDPTAIVGSRLLLSMVQGPVPECSDFLELAWLYDVGYRTFMLCDELCLKEDLLSTAVNAFDSFRQAYAQ